MVLSDKPNSNAHTQPSRAKIVAATVAGNAIEFYDFLTYSFFAVYIGSSFFPSDNKLTSLLNSLAVFGVGFITRPIGGILIGAYADRAGRRPALLLTIMLITLGTLGLALTPSYASIGILAPIIVVTCRLIQGFALGGEVGPSSSFLVEIAPAHQRGLYGAWQLGSQGIAILVAGMMGFTIASVLPDEDLISWGWRIPFVIGLLLIPVAVYLRRCMPETIQTTEPKALIPLSELRQHGSFIFLALMVILGGTVSTYIASYMTTFAITTLQLPNNMAMLATVAVGIFTFIGAMLGGILSDKYGRRIVMVIPRVLVVLTIIPLIMLLTSATSTTNLFIVSAIMALLNTISAGASLVAIPELLPKRIRALGLSIAYAIGVTLFGGSTQFVITWLIKVTDTPLSLAWYVVATSTITAVAMWMMPESRHIELKD